MESGAGDEGLVAVLARATDIGGSMHAGPQVAPEIALAVEEASAIRAVVVTLAAVLVEAKLSRE